MGSIGSIFIVLAEHFFLKALTNFNTLKWLYVSVAGKLSCLVSCHIVLLCVVDAEDAQCFSVLSIGYGGPDVWLSRLLNSL